MGGATSNCNKNYSLRQKYFDKYTEKYSISSSSAAAVGKSADGDRGNGQISAANNRSSNNNKPEGRGGTTGSRNRSASVGDEVSEPDLRMTSNRRPLEGSRNIDTRGGSVERRLDYGRDASMIVRQMTTTTTTTAATGNSIGGGGGGGRSISGARGSWASARAASGSRNSSLRSDTSRGSPSRRGDSPGSGSEVFGTGNRFPSVDSAAAFRAGRHYGGGDKAVQRSSDTQLEQLTMAGVDDPVVLPRSSPSPRNPVGLTGGGSVRITATASGASPRSRTQRRSSISFLPVAETTTSSSSSSLGLFPVPAGTVRSGTSMAAVSPMDKVNISLGNATDLVASLIGTATSSSSGGSGFAGGGGGGGGQSKQEDSFWVPSTVWRKKRAQSLVPQRQSAEGEAPHDGTKAVPSASNSMQEMSVECPLEPGVGQPLVSGSGGQSASSDGQQQQQQLQQQGGGGGGRRRRASMQDALDFSKFNASLYERPPLVSEKQFGSIQEENCGSINISLGYETDLSLLTVCVIRAQDLTPSRPGRPSVDPYCRICLLPNRKRQFHTKIRRRTTSPEFDEEFVFDVVQSALAEAALELAIFDASEGAAGDQGDCLGVVHLPLDEINLSERVWMWKGISPFVKQSEKDSAGELMLSMTYLSSAERLTVVVSKARNLRHQDDSKSSAVNPFVRVALLSGGKRTKKKRTSTKRNTLNPIWNEALVFCLQGKEHLGGIHLEVGVFTDNYLLGNNEPIGKVILGSENTADDCLTHWLELVNNRNAPARWHQLHYQT